MVNPPVPPEAWGRFELFVQNIFAVAVDGLLAHRAYDGYPVVALRDELKCFLGEMERAQAAIASLDPGVGRLIDGELAELARKQGAPLDLPRTSIEGWRVATSDMIGLIIGVSHRLQIEPVKGESGTVYRQMTRGLLALVYALTGKLPKRSTKRRLVGSTLSQQEDYWFLSLTQRLAEMVFARVEAAPKQAQKLQEEPSGDEGLQSSAPDSSGKERKRVGAPSLTNIVREELKAFKEELAKKASADAAGGEQARSPDI